MNYDLVIPRLSANDDVVTLVEWLVADGDRVLAADIVLVVETTKAVVDIPAGREGIIHILVEEGKECRVGTVVASLTDGSGEEENGEGKPVEQKDEGNSAVFERCTKKAWELIEKHKVPLDCLPENKIIREKDVAKLIDQPAAGQSVSGNTVVLYGGGDIVKGIIDIIRQTCAYTIEGIVIASYTGGKRDIGGIPVIGNNAVLSELLEKGNRKIINAMVASNQKEILVRKATYSMLKKMGFDFPNIIHNRAIIEPTVQMAEGNLVCAASMLGSYVTMGSNCVINSGAIINHDTVIGDHCHLASGAIVAGNVLIGSNTVVGQGVTVYHHVQIGSNVIIQNGCRVFRDIPDNTIVQK